jgi:hypothetical protein
MYIMSVNVQAANACMHVCMYVWAGCNILFRHCELLHVCMYVMYVFIYLLAGYDILLGYCGVYVDGGKHGAKLGVRDAGQTLHKV